MDKRRVVVLANDTSAGVWLSRRTLLILAIGAVIAAAIVGAYVNILHNPFVFDDLTDIKDNPYIQHLWQPSGILLHTTRPMALFTFAVNFAIGRFDPYSFHIANIAIHVLVALLMFAVVRRSMESPWLQWKWAPWAPWLAGIVTLLWAVHPLQTESVTYTWQRCESLVGLFYLLTLYCVIRSSTSAEEEILWRVAAVASCALGMATKEAMVSAPVVILLYDRAFLADSWREVWRRRWPLHVGLAATWLVLIGLIVRGMIDPLVHDPTTKIGVNGVDSWHFLLTQSGVICYYLRLAFWPHPLCMDYGSGWGVAKSILEVWPYLLVIGALLLLTAWAWWRKPALGFIGAWFFLILSPTSSFVPIVDVAFEHRMYLPLVSLIVLVVLGVLALLDWLRDARRWLRWGAAGTAAAAAVALSAALMVVTIERNQDYSTEERIWQDTVDKSPNDARAHSNLGAALVQNHKLPEAIFHLQRAVELKPDYEEALNNLGLTLSYVGRREEAIARLREVLKLNPRFAAAHFNLGLILDQMNQPWEARQHYLKAVEIDPNYLQARYLLGNRLLEQGRLAEAAEQFRALLTLQPDDKVIKAKLIEVENLMDLQL